MLTIDLSKGTLAIGGKRIPKELAGSCQKQLFPNSSSGGESARQGMAGCAESGNFSTALLLARH
ncbi:hypothetical protein [Methylomicrobium lacus]|uniref:hypothetical protein n=1 Tax=Methylomicrobium lacus TaxID=136992 RepID=UPI0035A9679D